MNIKKDQDGRVHILAEDNRTLFELELTKEGALIVVAPICCKHDQKILDTSFLISARAPGYLKIAREVYK